MSERRDDGSTMLKVGLLLAGAFLLATIYAMWQIGSDRLYTLGLIITCAIALTLVLLAVAIIVRQYRRNDSPPVIERHFTDGTRTIVKEVKVLDGRAPAQNDIKLLQLPAQPQAGAFPEILRSAYAAGAATLPARSTSRPDPGYIESEIEEHDLHDWGAGWDGDIRG